MKAWIGRRWEEGDSFYLSFWWNDLGKTRRPIYHGSGKDDSMCIMSHKDPPESCRSPGGPFLLG